MGDGYTDADGKPVSGTPPNEMIRLFNQKAERLYRAGQSGMIDEDHGWIGGFASEVQLAVAGDLVGYKAEGAHVAYGFRIVRFTPKMVVIEREGARRHVSPRRIWRQARQR